MNAFLPVCTAVCFCFGYKFSLFNYIVCSVVFAAFSIVGVVFSFIIKEKAIKKSDTAALVLLPFFSLANWGLYLYESKSESVVIKICVLVCFVCSAVLVIKYVRPLILKIASITLSSLAILPLILFVGIKLYPFPKITVVKTVPSPEGTYYAEVTDCD